MFLQLKVKSKFDKKIYIGGFKKILLLLIPCCRSQDNVYKCCHKSEHTWPFLKEKEYYMYNHHLAGIKNKSSPTPHRN